FLRLGQAARATVAKVIVVGADDHRLVRQRSLALQHADDVLQIERVTFDLNVEADAPPFQQLTLRLQLAVDVLLYRRERRGATAGQDLLENGTVEMVGGHLDRYAGGGGEVEVEQVIAVPGGVGVVDEQDAEGIAFLGIDHLLGEGAVLSAALTVDGDKAIAG